MTSISQRLRQHRNETILAARQRIVDLIQRDAQAPLTTGELGELDRAATAAGADYDNLSAIQAAANAAQQAVNEAKDDAEARGRPQPAFSAQHQRVLDRHANAARKFLETGSVK